ncbi:hypothetical protein KIL84_005281, partial [Mauremys mutica]
MSRIQLLFAYHNHSGERSPSSRIPGTGCVGKALYSQFSTRWLISIQLTAMVAPPRKGKERPRMTPPVPCVAVLRGGSRIQYARASPELSQFFMPGRIGHQSWNDRVLPPRTEARLPNLMADKRREDPASVIDQRRSVRASLRVSASSLLELDKKGRP